MKWCDSCTILKNVMLDPVVRVIMIFWTNRRHWEPTQIHSMMVRKFGVLFSPFDLKCYVNRHWPGLVSSTVPVVGWARRPTALCQTSLLWTRSSWAPWAGRSPDRWSSAGYFDQCWPVDQRRMEDRAQEVKKRQHCSPICVMNVIRNYFHKIFW